MVTKRVSLYFFKDGDKERIKKKLQNIIESTSLLVGDMEEKEIEILGKEKGIIVNEIIESEKIETPGRVNPDYFSNNLKSHPIVSEVIEGIPEFNAIDETRTNIYIIKLKGPLFEEWRKQIESLGITIIESLPTFSFTAKLTADQAKKIMQKTFVQYLRLYDKIDTTSTLDEILPLEKTTTMFDSALPLKYDIVLHVPEDLEDTLRWLSSNKVKVIEHIGRRIRCEILPRSHLIEMIKELPEVAVITRTPQYRFHCDISRMLVGIDTDASTSEIISCLDEQGEGQIVCVADGGIYNNHPDLKDNIVDVRIWKKNNMDKNGHGTHIAGIIVGDGTTSNGKIRGIAPKARLFFQSLETEGDNTIDLKLSDTTDLLNDAYKVGARICNYSFGSTGFEYSTTAYDVDEFISTHPEMLVIRSAGNDANSKTAVYGKKGFVDWYSLDGEACFKNGLSVGASQSMRKGSPGGYVTWKEYKPEFFPDDPIASEKTSGDRESLAAFSGRGPAIDRIKPDVVAPGTDILSTLSLFPETQFNYKYIFDKNPNYAYMTGTSQSAPIVTGCAALIREYYIRKRNHRPSAALLKSTIINGTTWLTNLHAIADHNKVANIHQGFGLINIQQSIPTKANAAFRLEFVDSWTHPNMKFSKPDEKFDFEFSNNNQSSLRICMTYTDSKGESLQNILILALEHKDTETIYVGNEGIQRFGRSRIEEANKLRTSDRFNNVQVIRIKDCPAGTYRLRVFSLNITKPPQDFAVVLTGNELSPITAL